MGFTANKDGSVTLIAVVVLLAITGLAVTLKNVSSLELDMVANERQYTQGQSTTDGCAYATGKFVRWLVDFDEGVDGNKQFGIPLNDPVAPGILYPDSSVDDQVLATALLRDTVNIDKFELQKDEDGDGKPDYREELAYNPAILPAVVDLRPSGTAATQGTSSLEYDVGYHGGVGLGGAGSGAYTKWYVLVCEGRALDDPNPRVRQRTYGRYRKVLGMPGGL